MLVPLQERRLARCRIGRERRHREHAEQARVNERAWPTIEHQMFVDRPLYQAIVVACILMLTAGTIAEFATAIAGRPGNPWLIPIGLCATVCASVPLFASWVQAAGSTRSVVAGSWFLAGMSLTIVAHLSGWYLRYGSGTDHGVFPLILTATGFWAVLLTGWLAGELVEANRVSGA